MEGDDEIDSEGDEDAVYEGGDDSEVHTFINKIFMLHA